MRDSEKIYEHVFGKTFSDYKLPDLEEFIVPFQVRFERNNINPREIFDGKGAWMLVVATGEVLILCLEMELYLLKC
jgi:hypothetical protein